MRIGNVIVGMIGLVMTTAGATQADVFHMPTGQTSLEFVTVGDPGNATDTGGCLDLGAVAYTYKIGKFDVTSAQYCQFLNAVAATDAYGLYNPYMENVGGPYRYPPSRCGCGIKRSGVPGSYTYSVLPDSGVPGKPGYANYANFPVNYVSWGDAARFCNWLQNGQPTGAQGPDTTETGAYTLKDAITDKELMEIKRNSGAIFFLPTMHEWQKAAFYKGGGTNAGYWRYPTKSDTPPSNVLSSTNTNNANFLGTGYTDPISFLTPVGFFARSPGPYGTYDMGGNVSEWTESPLSKFSRFLLGASFQHRLNILAKTSLGNYYPSLDSNVTGFRVASLPAGFKTPKIAAADLPKKTSSAVLQPPVKLDELLVWRDGGSLGFKLSDANGRHLSFCIDGRIGSSTVGYFFLSVTHATQAGGLKLDPGGDTEKALISYLKSWLETNFKPERLTAISKMTVDVDKLAKDEFNAWHVLRVVENRAEVIQSVKPLSSLATNIGATDIGIDLSVERADKKPFTFGEAAESRFRIKNASDRILVIARLSPISNLGEEPIGLSSAVYGRVEKLKDRDGYLFSGLLQQETSMAFHGGLLFPNETMSVVTRYRALGSTEKFRIDYYSLGRSADKKFRIYTALGGNLKRNPMASIKYAPLSTAVWQQYASAHAEIRPLGPDCPPRAVLIPELSGKPDSVSVRVPMQFAGDAFSLEKAQPIGKRIAGGDGGKVLGFSQALGGYVVSGKEACWVLSSPLQTSQGSLYALVPPLLLKDVDVGGSLEICVGHEQKGDAQPEQPTGRTFWNRYPVYYGDGMYTEGEFLHISKKELKDFLLEVRQRKARFATYDYFFHSRYFILLP